MQSCICTIAPHSSTFSAAALSCCLTTLVRLNSNDQGDCAARLSIADCISLLLVRRFPRDPAPDGQGSCVAPDRLCGAGANEVRRGAGAPRGDGRRRRQRLAVRPHRVSTGISLFCLAQKVVPCVSTGHRGQPQPAVTVGHTSRVQPL